MHVFWVGGPAERAEQVVADAAGFEGAGGLEVVVFEEDSAAFDQSSVIAGAVQGFE